MATIISLLIIAEGGLALLFPSLMASVTEEFSGSSAAVKRRMGGLSVFIGVALLYFSRLWLARPMPHWVVSVTGVYMLLVGLFITVLPSAAGKALSWFYRDKKVTSFIGFILILAGIVLLILL